MAGEERKIAGYTPLGNPIYELPSSHGPTKAEMEEQLLHDLDCVLMFGNGKGYYEFCDDEYFEMDENEEPDISHLVKIDKDGGIISSRPFDIMED